MRPISKSLLPVLAVALALTLTACGSSGYGSGSSSSSSSSTATPSAATPGAVKTASNATLGATVLTDAQGLTLYSLSGESAGKFLCSNSACTQLWHPLSASAGAPSGVASLTIVTRPDGTKQVAYKGMPLYTFAQDQKPGDAKGQGFKDVGTWSAVTISSSAAGTEAAHSTPAAPAQSAPRTGY
jgi:predicted lipoprotein with Yx(FWY)xxD motif